MTLEKLEKQSKVHECPTLKDKEVCEQFVDVTTATQLHTADIASFHL